MLAAPYRLRKEREIKRVLAHGRSFFSPLFRVRALANRLVVSRFATVVSTRVSKKAVVRNTIRRRLTEIIRHHVSDIKPGYDVMISVNNKALAADYHQLEGQLLADFKKAKLTIL